MRSRRRSIRVSRSMRSSSANRTKWRTPARAASPSNPPAHGFNPLFLYGGVGLGKTHLMHAIAWELTERGGANGKPVSVAYLSAEKFMYRFIAAIRGHQTIQFKEQLRGVDVLMVDDLQFLIGKDNTQEEFFHTFNYLVEAGKQIVISADKSPSDLTALDNRLRTRLGCGMVADLHSTTFELRISILESKAARAGVPVPPKVLEFLAHKITSNVRELEGALNRLVAHANLFGRVITLETAQEVLHDILRAHDRKVTIEEIQKKVAEHYNIRQTEMTSARRARAVARPRQVAMYLSKQLTTRSLPEIGRKFGNRDHTTVMHAVSRVNELMQADGDFAEGVELLRRMLELSVDAGRAGRSLHQRPARRQKLLDRAGELVALGIADRQAQRHHAAPRQPDPLRQHIEKEQLLQFRIAFRRVGRRADRPARGVHREHRADAGELHRCVRRRHNAFNRSRNASPRAFSARAASGV